MMILGGWVFLMSEVPLWGVPEGSEDHVAFPGEAARDNFFSSYTKVYSVIYDSGSVPSKSHLLSS